MGHGGIDTSCYGAHSTCSATTSAASTANLPIHVIVKAARWETHAQCITLLRNIVDSFLRNCYALIVGGQIIESKCHARGCYRLKARHHTSLGEKNKTPYQCKDEKQKDTKLLSGFSQSKEDKSCPANVPIKSKELAFGHTQIQYWEGTWFQRKP